MKGENISRSRIQGGGVTVLVLLSILSVTSCNDNPVPVPHVLDEAQVGMDTAASRWVSWNVLFKDGTDRSKQEAGIFGIQNDIIAWVQAHGVTNGSAKFNIFYCPCDSLLFNIAATPLDGSGQSVNPPPPPPPPPAGSGDVLYVSQNNAMVESDSLPYPITDQRVILPADIRPNEKVLAIMDTGLDTSYFSRRIKDLIWMPAQSSDRIFNFVGSSLEDFRDDHADRHGTAVTTLALHAIKTYPYYPKLMILKALDYRKRGTTFTVSCALSFARQHHATVVNASLGYYEGNGKVDSIFRHYVHLCDAASPDPVIIVAAAGNTPGNHDPSKLCDPAPNSNRLTEGRMFYPGSFSVETGNLITVTGLSTIDRGACRYQNYSSTYVSIGLLNSPESPDGCCRYFVPFLDRGYEGTSFAAPIVSGMLLSYLSDPANPGGLEGFIQGSNTDPRLNAVTKNGRFLKYTDNTSW